MPHCTTRLRAGRFLCLTAASLALLAACNKADDNGNSASNAASPVSASNSGPQVAAPATAASDHPAGASQ